MTEEVLSPRFERVALIGIGLIGSSISHAARRAGIAGSIVLVIRDGYRRVPTR